MVISSMTHPTCHPPSKYLRPVVRGQLFKIGYFCILDILEAQSCVSHAQCACWLLGNTALQNFKLDTFLKTKSGFVGSYTGQYVREMFSVFEWIFADTSTANATPLKSPPGGKQNDANPHQGWRNPTKCACIIMIALTLLAKLNCRFAEHIFHIYFDWF